jgi:hypothetical protein
MEIRQNLYLEEIARKAVAISRLIAKKTTALSRRRGFSLASNSMLKAGMPYIVIERLLYEPHNTRISDHS